MRTKLISTGVYDTEFYRELTLELFRGKEDLLHTSFFPLRIQHLNPSKNAMP